MVENEKQQTDTDAPKLRKRHRKLKIALLVVLALSVIGGGALAFAVHRRLEQERAGTAAVGAPSIPRVKEMLRKTSSVKAKEVLADVMKLEDGDEIREYLHKVL